MLNIKAFNFQFCLYLMVIDYFCKASQLKFYSIMLLYFQYVDEKLSRKILEQARKQQEELQEEYGIK